MLILNIYIYIYIISIYLKKTRALMLSCKLISKGIGQLLKIAKCQSNQVNTQIPWSLCLMKRPDTQKSHAIMLT
jgi:hypothetical protein